MFYRALNVQVPQILVLVVSYQREFRRLDSLTARNVSFQKYFERHGTIGYASPRSARRVCRA